jgi:restriction system protein
MLDVTCAECGTLIELTVVSSAASRHPCPWCGSTSRLFSSSRSDSPDMNDSLEAESWTASLVERWRRDLAAFGTDITEPWGLEIGPSLADVFPGIRTLPDVLLQAEVVRFGDRTTDGQLIAGVCVAWIEIIAQLERDPAFLFKIPWRKLEEIIAGAYERAGWPEVVLTPRSGDRGRDVIATKPGIGSIRIVDQIKAYKPGHLVTADEVRSLVGVLSIEQNVSKGLVTTTSGFAPGIAEDAALKALMPYRLELKNGKELHQWLVQLGKRRLPDT